MFLNWKSLVKCINSRLKIFTTKDVNVLVKFFMNYNFVDKLLVGAYFYVVICLNVRKHYKDYDDFDKTLLKVAKIN